MIRRRPFCIAALPLATGSTAAQALDAPSGTPVLLLQGRLRHANHGSQALLDMAALERLPQTSVMAQPPWYSASRKFTGPLLREVLGLVGAQGKTLRAHALNDYHADLPVDDVQRWDVVLARLIDDRPVPVRDKGPLLIMYPLDAHESLRTTLVYSRCVWQLKAIDIL